MTVMPVLTHAADAATNAAYDAVEAAFRRVGMVAKRTFREFAAAVHPELRQAGWAVLNTVLRADNEACRVTVGDIIAETGMDKSVVSRQLRSLQDWDLVQLSRAETDARVVQVVGTENAHARLRGVRAQQRERYAALLRTWSTEDMVQLEVLLNRIADNFPE
jgi:DNA-binding MarR family transcriptional regulator